MSKEIVDTPERRLDAVRAFMALEGGFVRMVERGTSIDDLTERILHADPKTTDLTSLSQLMDLSDKMVFGGSAEVHWDERTTEEPLVDPEVARDWLTRQTARAVNKDGSLKFRAGQKPDHLGFAAMEIAVGDAPRLFSEVYAEVTNNQSPLSEDFLQNLAHKMVDGYLDNQPQ